MKRINRKLNFDYLNLKKTQLPKDIKGICLGTCTYADVVFLKSLQMREYCNFPNASMLL